MSELCFEGLLTAEGETDSTTNEKVFVAWLGAQWAYDDLTERLRRAASHGEHDEIIERLCDLVQSYTPCGAAGEGQEPV